MSNRGRPVSKLTGHTMQTALYAAAALCFAAAALPPPAMAQNVANSFAGFSAQRDQPVNIEADRLEVFDNKKQAFFSGAVKVTQGKLTMQSKKLAVTYADQSGKAKSKAGKKSKTGANAETAVKLIKATGRVVIDTPDNQSVTSEWALFDVPAQLITIGGNVVMSQGENIMKGEKLIVDLKNGTSRLVTGREHGPKTDKPGRITVILTPSKVNPAIPGVASTKKKASSGGTATQSGGSNSGGGAQGLPWLKTGPETSKIFEQE